MLKAIIDQLKTGSITNVFPKGDPVLNPQKPYIVVWQDSPIPESGRLDQGKNYYTISAHFQRGAIDYLDDYLFIELPTLLYGQILTTRDLRRVQVFLDFEGISTLIEGNDDTTISKERQAWTVAFY